MKFPACHLAAPAALSSVPLVRFRNAGKAAESTLIYVWKTCLWKTAATAEVGRGAKRNMKRLESNAA